jgi:hypothetical protein
MAGSLPKRPGAEEHVLRQVRRITKQAVIWVKHLIGSVQTPARAFSRVYATNAWGGEPGEFYSGEGSKTTFAAPYVDAVVALMRQHDVSRVVDLGCGDFRVGRTLCDTDPTIEYVGVDVVPALIARNQQEFGTDRIRFVATNIDGGDLPAGDICLIRQVLQHMSNAEIGRVLAAVTAQYPLVVITEHQPPRTKRRRYNVKLGHGYGNRLLRGSAIQVDQPPFNLPSVTVLLEVPYSADGDFLQTVVATS